MLKLLAAGAVAVPVTAASIVAATGVIVVDVREGGRDGHHFVVPVPLLLAQAGAAFVPEHHLRTGLGEAERYLPVAREVLEALAKAEDAELVRVEDRGETVVVEKHGGMLLVRVQQRRGERVNVSVPLELALAALPDAGGRISPSGAVAALRHARFTQIVDVEGDDGERVKLSVW